METYYNASSEIPINILVSSVIVYAVWKLIRKIKFQKLSVANNLAKELIVEYNSETQINLMIIEAEKFISAARKTSQWAVGIVLTITISVATIFNGITTAILDKVLPRFIDDFFSGYIGEQKDISIEKKWEFVIKLFTDDFKLNDLLPLIVFCVLVIVLFIYLIYFLFQINTLSVRLSLKTLRNMNYILLKEKKEK
jgi:hypothetical protein